MKNIACNIVLNAKKVLIHAQNALKNIIVAIGLALNVQTKLHVPNAKTDFIWINKGIFALCKIHVMMNIVFHVTKKS